MHRLAPFSPRLRLLIGLAAALAACSSPNSETPAPTAPLALPQVTPTATPTVPLPAAPTLPPTSEPSGPKEIELRFTDPETQQECVAHFPFEVLADAEHSITGGGVIDCRFETQQCGEGVCITYHSDYAMDAELRGFVRASTPSYPDGMLEAYLNGTFTMTQYWTDVPPETFVAFTEASPFVASNSDIIPLAFDYHDGATAQIGGEGEAGEFPWVFTLRLK